MVKYPVKQRRGKNGITHHLGLVGDLLVGGKDDGRSLVSVADKGEETVCLASADGRVTYFVDDDQLSLFDVPYPEARGAFRVRVVKEFDQVDHLFLLDVQLLWRGFAWLDTGTMASLLQAANFVETIQSRQGIVISAPEEIAYINGFIGKEKLAESAKAYGKSPYGEHLKAVAEGRVKY